MPRRRMTFAKPGGSAKRGEMVSAFGKAYIAKRDTDSSPPGDDWQPAVIETEAFAFAGPPGRDGTAGRDGRDGRDGVGKDGEGFTPRGEWKRFNTYERGDVVSHEGSSYVAKAESTRREPPASEWQLLAAAGERGLRGERGEQGGAGQRGRSVLVETDAFGTQTAKAFFDSAAVRGSVVRVSANNHVDLALAHGSDELALAVGLAVAATEQNGFGNYVTGGPFTNESWNLTPGATYYLSPTNPGEITDVWPNTIGDYVCILGMALTPTTLNLQIHWALYVGS